MHVQSYGNSFENYGNDEIFEENSTPSPNTPGFSPKKRAFSIFEQERKTRGFSMKPANKYERDDVMIVSWNAPLHYLNRESFRFGVIKKTGGLNPRKLVIQGEDNKTMDTMETSNMSDPETLETSASVNNVQIEVKNQKKVLILELNVPFSD